MTNIADTLARLSDEYPAWDVEYAEEAGVRWTARRRRDSSWRGGFSVIEARDADALERLLGDATRSAGKIAAKGTAHTEPAPTEGAADGTVSDTMLRQLRDESRATVSDGTLRRLTGSDYTSDES